MNTFNQIGASQIANVYFLTSGDNTSALQSAINAAVAQSAPLYVFGSGSCSSTINVTGGLKMVGDGMAETTISFAGSPGLLINTISPCTFEDLQFVGANASGVDVVQVTAGTGAENPQSAFERVGFTAPAGAIGLHMIKASGWSLAHCRFGVAGNNATCLALENQNNGDSGDNGIVDCQFWATVNGLTGTIGILWKSGGGIRLTNFKFNDINNPLVVQLAASLNTSDFIISDGSFENYSICAISLQNTGSGTFQNFQVTNCQFSSFFASTIDIETQGTVAWLFNVQITSCVFNGDAGTSYAIVLNAVTGVCVLINIFRSGNSGIYNSIIIQSLTSHGVVGLSTLVSGGGTMNAIVNSGTSITTVAPV